ncbi:F0F1 ATP synthase subunit delta [Bifidobacterium choloepi]|uniref:ATP synthase subunit delta n=1 Tax=Bifidobacterium choloepi TaxID=2614131 RepID=A0A6I5NCQ4_9BIFI|nr:F0F1 ATP synthase subunit delta [Bifidobacterium choloepi]NEG70320.1 F0F1 ATP synthase subunit delta [Bifidobacterium choloepi]
MRGEASRMSDRDSRDLMAKKIAALGDDAWQLGNEMFTITDVLDANPRLQRALTDPGRPVADKTAVLHTLLGDEALPLTGEIMSDLVNRTWSRAYDIDNAVEDFGVDAMMYKADADGDTLQVSIELAQLQSALLNLPVVRSRLSDAQAPAKARIELLHALIDPMNMKPVTVRLAEHCASNPRKRRFLETIQWLIEKFSRHMGESLVVVTTATPLKQEQIDKLVEIYSKKVGHPVHINSMVDPTVLGGMRVQVGDEVTDNTVVAQLENLQRKAKAGAVL